MSRITLVLNANVFSGYGILCNELIKGLAAMGHHPSVRAVAKSEPFGVKIPVEFASRFVSRVQPEPFEVLIHPPEIMPTPGKRTVYFTMWESTRLPEKGIAVLKNAEFIVVPNHWNAACFSALLDKQIFVVPLGIDPQVFNYSPPDISGPCVFGASGRMGPGVGGGPRKGIDRVIDMFQKAFPGEKDVKLKVKIFEDCNVGNPTDPRIEFERKFLSDHDLARWTKSLTAFVCASKGEGWGLLQHQAMACGRPVIGVKYGGLAEFMGDHNSYPVKFTHEPGQTYYTGCGTMPEIDERDCIEKMQSVYRNRSDALRIGIEAHLTASKFTWERTCRELVAVLEKVGAL